MVLVVTTLEDYHSIAVQAVLRRMGLSTQALYTDAHPIIASHHLSLCETAETFSASGLPACFELSEISAVWYRRRGLNDIYKNYSKKHSDGEFLYQTIRMYNISLFAYLEHAISPGSRWVNAPSSAYRADSKMTQLKAARQVGLQVPNTIVSNDPGKIRQYAARHGKIICKGFVPFLWKSNEEQSVFSTTAVVPDDLLQDDSTLNHQPAIYQPRIHKSFEVRSTFLGETEFSLRIDSQKRDATRLDWRVKSPTPETTAVMALPQSIRSACRAMMKMLGLNFACFDFIVDEAGRYIFLELNESGQFLWVESIQPSVQLLHAFAHFLAHGSLSGWRADPQFGLASIEVSEDFSEIFEHERGLLREAKRSSTKSASQSSERIEHGLDQQKARASTDG